MDNIIEVKDYKGNKFEVEVLDIFTVDEYPDKEYILYTRGEEIDNDNVEAFVSILEEHDGEYEFLNIEDENEWRVISNIINKDGDGNA